MPNVFDCDIVVSNFELQSRYYIHFPLGKVWTSPLLFFYKDGFNIK